MFAMEAFRFPLWKRAAENTSLASILNFVTVDFALSPYFSSPCKGRKHKYTWASAGPCTENVIMLQCDWNEVFGERSVRNSRVDQSEVLNRRNVSKLLPPGTGAGKKPKKGHTGYLHPSHSRFHSVHPQCIHRNAPSSCPRFHCAGSPAPSLSHAEQQNGESPQSQAWHSNRAH